MGEKDDRTKSVGTDVGRATNNHGTLHIMTSGGGGPSRILAEKGAMARGGVRLLDVSCKGGRDTTVHR